jgi:phosphoenolpyruvate-protein phosphotransferase (PTS system enzyme I)
MGRRFTGIGVSSGTAIGRAVVIAPDSSPTVPVPVSPERVDEEVARFHQARERARRELKDLKARMLRVLGEAYAGILEAQLLILDDANLVGETVEKIRAGRVSAPWALKEVVHAFMRRFDSIDDGYLRERGGDLADVHRRLQRLLHGESGADAVMPEGPLIVVAHTLGPSDTMVLAREGVVGFATDMGGPTSHTAILAQALSLPAVVGLHDLSLNVRPGDLVALDGETGTVDLAPGAEDLARVKERCEASTAREAAMAAARDLPATTEDGVEITLRANIELPQEVTAAIRYGARGIGLYRSEFLFLSRAPEFPSEEEHYHTYRELAEKVAPHPAVIRTLDLGGEKYYHEVLDRGETNPVLGLRAVRFCLTRPDIFLPQLRGLLRAAAHADVRIMIPLVTTVAEIRQVKKILLEEAALLKAKGIPCRADVPVGIMVEVPAAAATADLLARESAFFSLGTNDLIQYALAVDRGNESVAYLYQPLHPAVLRMLRFVVRAGRERGIGVSICGEMAGDLSLTRMLVGLGIREMSVQPRAIAAVRETIRRFRAADAARIAEGALEEFLPAEAEREIAPGEATSS